MLSRATGANVTKSEDVFRHIRYAVCVRYASVRYARIGQVHCGHWRDRDAHRSGNVEWFRPEMARPAARRHPDRARTFFVLFSHRNLHRY
jgi:hypothetical protein